MKKLKLLTAVLFCLGVAGMASAAEVINIDFNKQGNNIAYSGTSPADVGTTLWRVYYGDPNKTLGKAMGSPRTANLRNSNEPCMPGTYAAQVWISVDVNDANYETYGPVDGNGLMDDGFQKTGTATADPCIIMWGKGAYRCDPNYMSYDIYVYGANEGNFTITSPGRNETKHISGGEDNYAVFEDVNFYDVNLVNFGTDSNKVILSYTNNLNGLQLVKQLRGVDKKRVEIQDGVEVKANEYDVAYETNARNGETTFFGPDLATITTEISGMNIPAISYIDSDEYMEYDIHVADGNEGEYQIDANVEVLYGNCENLYVYIDNIQVGSLKFIITEGTVLKEFYWTDLESAGFGYTHQSATCFLPEGNHTFKWRLPATQYFDLEKFKFKYIGPLSGMDCNDVKFYGLNDPNDFTNDCHVDFKDFKILVENWWAVCYDPNTDNCP